MKQLIKASNNDAKTYCFDHPNQHRFVEMIANQVGNQVQFDVELEEWDWKYDEFDEDDNCGHQNNACKGDDYYLKNFYINNPNLWAIKGHKFSNISANLVATLTKLNSHSFVTYDCELNQLQFINLAPGYHLKDEDYVSDDQDGMMLQAVFKFEQDFINYNNDQLAEFAKLIKELRKHLLVKDIRSKNSDELIYNIEHLDKNQQDYYREFSNTYNDHDERLLTTKIIFNVNKQGKISDINAIDEIIEYGEGEYNNKHQWLDQLNKNSPLWQILMKHNPDLLKQSKSKSFQF